MPGVDIVPTRQGSLIGLMVSLSGPPFIRTEKGFFSLSGAATSADFSPTQKWLIVFSGTPRVHDG
jgi:hypothetical protein